MPRGPTYDAPISVPRQPEPQGPEVQAEIDRLAAEREEEGLTAREQADRLAAEIESSTEGVDLSPIERGGRAGFLGDPTITMDDNANQLKPTFYQSAREAEPEPFMGGKFMIYRGGDVRPGAGSTVILPGEGRFPRRVASYDGETLVVDPEFRGQGIATELVMDFRSRNPDVPPAEYRTRGAQATQERAYDRLESEIEARRRRGLEGPEGQVREDVQEDMFGGAAPAEGGEQFGMGLGGPRRPEGLTQAEQRAKATVDRLRPLVEQKAATPEQVEEYREALALLNRDRPMGADEIALRSEEPAEPDDTGDLFEGLEGPEGGVREGEQTEMFTDIVTWGSVEEAEKAKQAILAENKALRERLSVEDRLRLVGEREQEVMDNLTIDFTGTRIRGPGDIAALFAPYRNPKYEVVMTDYLRDLPGGGYEVLDVQLHTSGRVGEAMMSDPARIERIVRTAKALGADTVIPAHNHPSGDPYRSKEDIAAWVKGREELAKHGIKSPDHVVVDDGTAWSIGGELLGEQTNYTFDTQGAPDWSSPTARVSGPGDIAALYTKLADPGGFAMMYLHGQNGPIAFSTHPPEHLARMRKDGPIPFQERMENLGAARAIAIIDGQAADADAIYDELTDLQRTYKMGWEGLGGFMDVIVARGGQMRRSAMADGDLEYIPRKDASTTILREDLAPYGDEPPATGLTGPGEAVAESEPPYEGERPRLQGTETRPYEADDFLRTTLGETGLDPETERIFREEFERATKATGTFRRRVTDEEVIAHANAIGQDGVALQRTLEGQGLNAAEQLALLSIARSNTRRMADALAKIETKTGADGGPLKKSERLALGREIEKRAELNNRLLSKWAEEGSEAGRTLRARQLAAFSIDDPVAVLAFARRLKGKTGGKPGELTDEEQSWIIHAVETGDREALAEHLTSLEHQTVLSKLWGAIKAMMLSLLQTWSVNLSSNAIKALISPVERFYTGIADRMIARQREAISGETFARTIQVGRSDVEGFKSYPESLGMAGRAWWYSFTGKLPEGTGEEVIDAMRRATRHRTDVRRRLEYMDPKKRPIKQPVMWMTDRFVNGVLGGLGAGDILFRHPARVRSYFEQAMIHAKREGLTPGTPEYRERVQRLVEDPTGAMERQAQLDSNEAVFMDPTGFFDGLDDIIQKIKRNETALGLPGAHGAETLVPFTRTLLGIADQTTDLTGLGLLRGPMNASKMLRFLEEQVNRPDRQMALGQGENALDPNNPDDAAIIEEIDAAQKQAAKQAGRGMMGATAFLLLASLGSYLALRDRLKTRYPRDQREQELWRAQDIRPNSILINGKWRQTDFLGPYGLALMIGAYSHDIATADEDEREGVWGESIRFGTRFAEQMMHVIGAVTIAQGLETISEITAGEEGSIEDYVQGVTRMPYPNIMRGVARAIDPVRREWDWESPLQQYAASTPGLSKNYPPRVDAFGNDIVGPEGIYANIVSPSRGARPDKRETDPLLAEADRLGTMPIRPRRSTVENWAKQNGIELTNWEWYAIQKVYGEEMARITRDMISSPTYRRASDEERKAELERRWTSAKSSLNDELKADMAKAGRGQQARQQGLQGPRRAVGQR